MDVITSNGDDQGSVENLPVNYAEVIARNFNLLVSFEVYTFF